MKLDIHRIVRTDKGRGKAQVSGLFSDRKAAAPRTMNNESGKTDSHQMQAVDEHQVQEWGERWDELELFVEGRSLEIRTVSDTVGLCRFKPIVYSRQSPRQGEISETGALRMEIHRLLTGLLKRSGIATSYIGFAGDFAAVRLTRVPPIEVIVKAALVGTPLSLYRDITGVPTRFGGFLPRNVRHDPYVRFDWRNRYPDKDEVMPTGLADQFIDTKAAETLALTAFGILRDFFARISLDLFDMVFTMDAAGTFLTSELSPETMRLKRKADGASYDADLWRKDNPPELVVERLGEIRDLLAALLSH